MPSSYTDHRHHQARFGDMPEGFDALKSAKPPIKGNVYVELLHQTDEGWAVGPRINAKFITEDQWASLAKAKGRWRLAPDTPPPNIHETAQTLPPEEIEKMLAREAARAANGLAPPDEESSQTAAPHDDA